MRPSINRSQNRLPQRFPVGATYVVEGFGGDAGKLRVIARYVVLPDGQRINVPAHRPALPASPRTLALRRQPDSKRYSKKPAAKYHPRQTSKKFVARRGTA